MCHICRQRFPKAALTRLVANAEGLWQVDTRQRQPGRGAYLCQESACHEALLAGRSKRPLHLDPDCRELFASGQALRGQGSEDEKKVLRLLGFARRSGQYQAGYDAVMASIQQGSASFVIVAKDAAQAQSMSKLCEDKKIPYGQLSQKLALGQSMGRRPTAYCAVLDQGLAQGIARVVAAMGDDA